MEDYPSYPVYKGLQLPLEFMGIRGRFLKLYAVILGVAFLGAFLSQGLIGSLGSIALAVVAAAAGFLYVRIEQKKGLHKKRKEYGVFVSGKLFSNCL